MTTTQQSTDLTSLTASALIEGYKKKHFTPVEVLDAINDRIDALNPDINAFYVRERDVAARSAKASESRWVSGLTVGELDGVPITLKETLATSGSPIPSGTAALAEAPAQIADSPVAQSTNTEGAVRLGKTVMPDYGMLSSGVSSLHGITRNPWNREWTVGGSSAGSSAAAAARFGPIHIGSDIGGSVRLPATWTGLASLKPTYAIVPVDPPYMGRTIGPLARTVDDVAIAMHTIARPDALDRDYTYQRGPTNWGAVATECFDEPRIATLKVAIHTDAGCGLATDPQVRAIVEAVGQTFSRAGAAVEAIDPILSPNELEKLDLFLRARSWLDIKNLGQPQRDRVLPYIMQWVLGAADIAGTQLMDAYQTVQKMRSKTIQATRLYDVVLSPVAPVAAFPAHWHGPTNDPDTALDHIAYTAPYNFSGQPAATVNAGFTSDGRPVGVQLAGRRFDDVRLLQIVKWYEGARSEDAVPQWPC
ncbi:amidase (plasmid) [Rhodococcoides fascians]|uniref:amidase n=1 Tax=Rhodococcoides fascians TaxID=1828 RepID=UPI003899F770